MACRQEIRLIKAKAMYTIYYILLTGPLKVQNGETWFWLFLVPLKSDG